MLFCVRRQLLITFKIFTNPGKKPFNHYSPLFACICQCKAQVRRRGRKTAETGETKTVWTPPAGAEGAVRRYRTRAFIPRSSASAILPRQLARLPQKPIFQVSRCWEWWQSLSVIDIPFVCVLCGGFFLFFLRDACQRDSRGMGGARSNVWLSLMNCAFVCTAERVW